MRLRIVRSAAELNRPDAVIIPGSKNTLADLDYLRRSGLAERIERVGRGGRDGNRGHLRRFPDARPRNSRSAGDRIGGGRFAAGWGCCGVDTVMAAGKDAGSHARPGMAPPGSTCRATKSITGKRRSARARRLLTSADGQVVGVASQRRADLGHVLARRVRRRRASAAGSSTGSASRRGLPPVGQLVGRYDIEPALDRLAEVVRASLRMDEIYRLMGLR